MSSLPEGPGSPPSLRRWRWPLALGVLALSVTPLWALNNVPQSVRIPSVKERAKPAPAVFSHWEHDQLQCFACHPGTFPQAPKGFTHQDMKEGRYCASCHDGRATTAIKEMRCEVCHVAP